MLDTDERLRRENEELERRIKEKELEKMELLRKIKAELDKNKQQGQN